MKNTIPTNTYIKRVRARVLCKGKPFLSSSDTSRVTQVTNPMISHESEKDRIVITTNGKYP